MTFLDFSVRVRPLIEVKKKGKGNAKPCGFYTHYYLPSNYNNIYNNYVLYAITNVTTVMYCIVIVSHDCYMFSYRCTLLLCIQYVYTRF